VSEILGFTQKLDVKKYGYNAAVGLVFAEAF
jgi:hypothetical protein